MDKQTAMTKMVPPSQRRPDIWRNGVIQVWITRACDMSCFGCTQGSNLGGKPGMITVEQFTTAVSTLSEYFGVVGIFGGNPCLAAGTRVHTSAGLLPIEELEGHVFTVRNSRGESKPATCWKAGTGRRLYEIKLRGGHTHFATADHEWPVVVLKYGDNHKRKDRDAYNPRKQVVPQGKIRTVDLRPGMRLPIASNDILDFGHQGTSDDGFLAGWILGDGWVTKKKSKRERTRVDGQPDKRFAENGPISKIGLIVNTTDHASGITAKLTARLRQLGSDANFRAVKMCQEISVQHTGVDTWLDHFGVLGKHDGLPTSVWCTASESFRKGLIDGLFSADGTVEVGRGGNVRIRLTTAHEKLASDVATLLSFYGIKSQISSRERAGAFPNGKDYQRVYVSYDVSISDTSSTSRFASLFPLTHADKNAKLQHAVGQHKPDAAATSVEILSVTATDRYEDVWDIGVDDDTHTFQISHCVTGNCMHPKFEEMCEILRKHVKWEHRGLWCNHPRGKGAAVRATFNPAVSNLNVHLSREAFDEFVRDWPECAKYIKGLDPTWPEAIALQSNKKEYEKRVGDARHSPPYVAMQDIDVLPFPDGTTRENTEENRWELISECDINKYWSAIICVFRDQLRAYFCEIAGAQAMLHQANPAYPDLGKPVVEDWWRVPMADYEAQAAYHCHACGIPLRGYGDLAVGGTTEQVSATHADIFKPKHSSRQVQLVQLSTELSGQALARATNYIENGDRPVS